MAHGENDEPLAQKSLQKIISAEGKGSQPTPKESGDQKDQINDHPATSHSNGKSTKRPQKVPVVNLKNNEPKPKSKPKPNPNTKQATI